MITDEQTLSMPLLTKLVIFFNTSSAKDGGYNVTSSYRKSKYGDGVEPDYTYADTASNLTDMLGIPFSCSGVRQLCSITPSVTASLDDYRRRLYKSIVADVFSTNVDDDSLDSQIGFAMFLCSEEA